MDVHPSRPPGSSSIIRSAPSLASSLPKSPFSPPPQLFFFFQAEDGIRDADVTGVQTCALPISQPERRFFPRAFSRQARGQARSARARPLHRGGGAIRGRSAPAPGASSALRESGAGAARSVSGAGDPAPDHREGPAQSEEHLYADGKARTGARSHAQNAARDAGVGRGTSGSGAGVPPARMLPAGAVRPAELSAAAAAGAGRN